MVLARKTLAARKNGKATPAPLETTTSGRRRRTSRQASARFRKRFGMFRVVGWWAHETSSPSNSERLSGILNVTQDRSCCPHHALSRYSWSRCPPAEETNMTLRRGSCRSSPEGTGRIRDRSAGAAPEGGAGGVDWSVWPCWSTVGIEAETPLSSCRIGTARLGGASATGYAGLAAAA